jgi:hypothetical protein
MHLAYYDEAGDDGFPAHSSPLFVLAAFYQADLHWHENHRILVDFKHALAADFPIPFKEELHTRELLLNKMPYHAWNLSDEERIEIVTRWCKLVSQLNGRAIVTAVIKPRIKASRFNVLDKALSYSIQRIENDLAENTANRFLIITDEGRVGPMRRTSRRMQAINYLPSKFGEPYRREIKLLIEDPLPKSSTQSYFVQIADLLACLSYWLVLVDSGAGTLHNRMPKGLDRAKLGEWFEILRPVLNEKANPRHPHGIVEIPSA